jgi:adenylate cyclase
MAWQHYVTGHRSEEDVRATETIIRLCRRATEIDPDYAHAWALLAIGQMILHFAHGRAGDDGLVAIDRALVLGPGMAEAHAIKARILSRYGRQDEAAAEIETALRLDPDSYEVNRSAAYWSFRQQRLDDAIRYWEKATTLMNGDAHSPSMLITCYTAIGDLPSARRVAEITLSRVEKLLAQDQNNWSALTHGASALATLDQVERAKELMSRALLIQPDRMEMRYNFACTLAAQLNETDAAIDMLGPVMATMSLGFLNHAKVDPDLDPLRGDPRFKAMMAGAEARFTTTIEGGSSPGS